MGGESGGEDRRALTGTIMKILYFSDYYAWNVMGTKRSIAERVETEGHEVVFLNRDQVGQVLALIEEHGPDQVWLAHSSLTSEYPFAPAPRAGPSAQGLATRATRSRTRPGRRPRH